MKVHKHPFKTRPVTGTGGSLLAGILKWLDVQLQPLLKYLPSYFSDWEELLHDLELLGTLPKGAKLFTADARSMYTEIDTAHGIKAIENWFSKIMNEGKIDPTYPVEIIIQLLTLVMTSSTFALGDTFWKQLAGTAMGTPSACVYAALYFGWYKIETILPHFSTELKLYKIFIDDIFGIWLPASQNQWIAFKTKLKQYGPKPLVWDISELQDKVVMLDLKIRINNGIINTETYQKPMNLYLYVPFHSEHPGTPPQLYIRHTKTLLVAKIPSQVFPEGGKTIL